MKKSTYTVGCTLVLATGIVLGLGACSNVSGSVSHGSNSSNTRPGLSIEASTSYIDRKDAASDIADGLLPDLPDDARSIKRADHDGVRYISWKGSPVTDQSCKSDSATEIPDMPDAVLRKTLPSGEVVSCGSSHQANGGDFTYFWQPTK